jgi:hypothetical protein
MAVIDTSQSNFTANEQITSAKLNNILDQSVFVAGSTGGAVADGTLEVSGGQLRVKTIGTGNIGDSQVTTLKIADANVTPVKFSLGRIDFNNWTTDGAKVSTTTLAYGRTTSQAGTTNLDFRASDAAVNTTYDARISRASGAVGALSIDNVYDPADTTTDTRGQIDFKINGTAKLTIKQDGTILFGTTPLGAQTGTAPIYGARAFARVKIYNFSGIRTYAYKSGNYTGTSVGSNIATISITNHGLKTNDVIRLVFTKTSGTGTNPVSATVFTVTSSANANTFTVAATGVGTATGTVIAEFFGSSKLKNVSSVSAYDADANGFILNFSTPMPDADYATVVTGQYIIGTGISVCGELSTRTQFYNTVNQAYCGTNATDRVTNVVIFG